MKLHDICRLVFLGAMLFASGLIFTNTFPRALAQEASRPPSDAELTQHKVQALSAEMTYAQALITRLNAELAASEARGKWAVAKLWDLPVPDSKGVP